MNASTAYELDMLYERESDRMIEEIFGALYAESANWEPAINKLKEARRFLYQAAEKLATAAELVSGSIAEPRIMDLLDNAEECSDNITQQIFRMEE